MVHLRNLVHERGDAFAERVRVVIHDYVEVYTVFAARKKGFAVVSAEEKPHDVRRGFAQGTG